MYHVKDIFEGKQLGEASWVFIVIKNKVTIPEAVICKEVVAVAWKKIQETALVRTGSGLA